MSNDIYLDHAATTPPCSEALAAFTEAAALWENPSAVYRAAGRSRGLLRACHAAIARTLQCDANQVVFTASGTEANALALYQAAGRHAVICAMEHASVPEAAKAYGCEVTLVEPGPDGVIDPRAVEAAIRPDTALISVQAANNETGVIQPTARIGAVARRKKVLFHCDAVQAYGQIPLEPEAMGIDLMSISAHKIYGLKGVGALYVGDRVRMRPLIPGSQQFGWRGGTENLPAIAAFAAAAETAMREMAARAARESSLRDRLQSALESAGGFRFPGAEAPRLPGLLSVILPGAESEKAILALDARGIRVSGGAACAAASQDPSHVLLAMGFSREEAKRALRISLGKDTTAEDVETAAREIAEVGK